MIRKNTNTIKKREKYTPAIALKIAELLAMGIAINEVSEKLHIETKTIYNWKANHPEFVELIDQYRREHIEKITVKAREGLEKLIMGYTQKEKSLTVYPDGKKQVVYHEKDIPTDRIACVIWLKMYGTKEEKEALTNQISVQPQQNVLVVTQEQREMIKGIVQRVKNQISDKKAKELVQQE